MASTKELRRRIASVKTTQQTTKAMKMVSAAKLRRAQEAITAQRPYARKLEELIRVLVAQAPELADEAMDGEVSDTGATKPLARFAAAIEAGAGAIADGEAPPRMLLVVVTSDRGLCGAFNSSVIRATQRWMMAHSAQYPGGVSLAFVGRRGFDFFKTKDVTIAANYSELGGKVTFAKATELARSLVELYRTGGFTEVKVIYNEFKNAVTQKTQVEAFLPLESGVTEPSTEVRTVAQAPALAEMGGMLLVKPSVRAIWDRLLSKHFAVQAFRVLLESQAGEHGARMSAMENATKNASEMIRKLTLEYNKQRQAGITKELLEIIAGSESQKGA